MRDTENGMIIWHFERDLRLKVQLHVDVLEIRKVKLPWEGWFPLGIDHDYLSGEVLLRPSANFSRNIYLSAPFKVIHRNGSEHEQNASELYGNSPTKQQTQYQNQDM